MNIRRCQPSESKAGSRWIAARHYLQSCPPGYVFVLEFLEGREMVGAMLLGRPCSKSYDADKIMQLHRVFFVDEAPKNTEIQGLSMMRRFIRTWCPGVRLLLSYSDPAQGHKGTIYEADGWAPLGMTTSKSGYGWKSRPNRKDDPVSPKQRWVRTP